MPKDFPNVGVDCSLSQITFRTLERRSDSASGWDAAMRRPTQQKSSNMELVHMKENTESTIRQNEYWIISSRKTAS